MPNRDGFDKFLNCTYGGKFAYNSEVVNKKVTENKVLLY